MFSGEADAQPLAGQGTGSASTSLQASGFVGEMSIMKKCDSWGRVNSTCADGNLAGVVQATRGPTELLEFAVTGQDVGALGLLETSRDQPNLVLSMDDSFSHRPKSLASQSPKGPLLQKSLNPKASSGKNEKEKSELMNVAAAAHVGVIFQAKAQGKEKQMLGKGNMKKVARAKGKASEDQTLMQLLKSGVKRRRVTEASEEENIWAPKHLCSGHFGSC